MHLRCSELISEVLPACSQKCFRLLRHDLRNASEMFQSAQTCSQKCFRLLKNGFRTASAMSQNDQKLTHNSYSVCFFSLKYCLDTHSYWLKASRLKCYRLYTGSSTLLKPYLNPIKHYETPINFYEKPCKSRLKPS